MALSAVGLKTHIWNNNISSIALLLGYPFLLILMVWMFFAGLEWWGKMDARPHIAAQMDPMQAGLEGVANYGHWAVAAAGVWFVIAFLFHQQMINRSTGARPVSRKEEPKLYNMLENLCISRGMTMPKLCIIESPVLNAYASGISDKNYTITLTRGIIQTLNDDEIEAVIGHELTHIINRDVRLLIIGVIFVGMLSFLAEMAFRSLLYGGHYGRARTSSRGHRNQGGVMLVAVVVLAIGYLLSLVIRFSLSRKREYLADAGSVELTKKPAAMMSALMKISGHSKLEKAPDEVRQMFIDNASPFLGLFATHPPIEQRIAVLEESTGTPRPSIEALPTETMTQASQEIVREASRPRRAWEEDHYIPRGPWSD